VAVFSRSEAQQRADAVRTFQRELELLEHEGVLVLSDGQRRALATYHGNLLAEGGGLGMFRGRAQVSGGTRDSGIVYSGGFSHLNVTRGVDGQDEARNTSGQGRVLFRLTPTATLSGRIYATTSRLQLNNSPQAIGKVYTGVDSMTRQSRAGVIDRHRLKDRHGR